MKKLATFVGALALTAVFGASGVGLDKTKHAKDVELEDIAQSGFLDDYSILKKSGPDDTILALYAYINPKANWPSYKNVLLDPVQIWRSKSEEGAPLEDIQRLANDFYVRINKELSKDYTIVHEIGPNTFRFQVVLVNLQKDKPLMDKVTTVMPIGRVISGVKRFATGKPSFVGEASLELKVTDAQTGELLLAVVDRRVGDKSIVKKMESWEDVQNILGVWSEIVRFRFCQLREGKDCVKPEI